jgi:hypothetical protein
MNPNKLSVRMDTETGDLWLTEEKYRQPIKRVANITQHVYLALCADLVMESGTKRVERDVKFADGSAIRITLEELESADVTVNPS